MTFRILRRRVKFIPVPTKEASCIAGASAMFTEVRKVNGPKFSVLLLESLKDFHFSVLNPKLSHKILCKESN